MPSRVHCPTRGSHRCRRDGLDDRRLATSSRSSPGVRQSRNSGFFGSSESPVEIPCGLSLFCDEAARFVIECRMERRIFMSNVMASWAAAGASLREPTAEIELVQTEPGSQLEPSRPRVSIGLPVYNGERFLEDAIRSILAQSYTDFELIISDNASTDRTREICERYARRDARIRYTRSPRNRGGAWNFSRVFELARGEFFKWAAHDDILAPDYLRSCVAVLDGDPTLIVCHSGSRRIDESGRTTGVYLATVAAADPCERFRRAVKTTYPIELFGVFKTSVLSETNLMAPHPQADIDLLQQLVLLGNIGRVPEVLFSRRSHAESYSEGTTAFRDRLNAMAPGRRTPYILFCVTRFLRLNMQVVRSPLPWSSRFRCLGLLLARTAREVHRRLTGQPIIPE